MPKVVRLGIVGLGAQGGMYKLVSDGRIDDMVLGACSDIDPSKMVVAESYGVPFFEDYQAMLASGVVDAVVTTLPHYLHPEVAVGALRAGIHVLVEKPAGVYTAQVDELIGVAAFHTELTFAIMFHQRTNPLYVDLHATLASGDLGCAPPDGLDHHHLVASQAYYDQSEWRATWGGEGGGVLVNQAPHQLDLWQVVTGASGRRGSLRSDPSRAFVDQRTRPELEVTELRRRLDTGDDIAVLPGPGATRRSPGSLRRFQW